VRALVACLILASVAAAPAPEPEYKRPGPSAPEYGHGMTAAEARDGWVSLFDGTTAFGWTGATVRDGVLSAGTTTAALPAFDLRGEVLHGGDVVCGGRRLAVAPGAIAGRLGSGRIAPVQLGPGVVVRSLLARPLRLTPVDLSDPATWKVIPHPTLPRERQATWKVIPERHALRAVGGPGCVELPGRFGDVILQVEVNCVKPLTNSGVFLRSRPGDFLNGYEVQVFNGTLDGDPDRPALYATGAIDKRRNARRVVSRDGRPFTLTVVAVGPHLSTWVNGVQQVDWTDGRAPHDNPRQGLRLEPGTIQLQAHDNSTDVEFSNLRVLRLDAEN
jgi:hypothetical protein